MSELSERLQRTDPSTPVTVAVPAWYGVADRHHVATHLDPDASRQLILVSSTLAAVHGHHLGRTEESSMHAVLSVDLRRGWSAGLVRVEPSGLTEVACWGASPDDSIGRIDDEVSSRWLVDQLLAAASTVAGVPAISAVLIIDDDGVAANMIRRVLLERDEGGAESAVFVKRARQVVAKGASAMRREGRAPESVGALAHALAVQADDDPEHPAMRVVAAEHAIFPSSTRLTFELGPDDGSPLHFDVYEQERATAADGEAVRGRAVLRAHLARERGYDRSMVVTFELGADGLFKIGPAMAWRLEWERPSVAVGGLG